MKTILPVELDFHVTFVVRYCLWTFYYKTEFKWTGKKSLVAVVHEKSTFKIVVYTWVSSSYHKLLELYIISRTKMESHSSPKLSTDIKQHFNITYFQQQSFSLGKLSSPRWKPACVIQLQSSGFPFCFLPHTWEKKEKPLEADCELMLRFFMGLPGPTYVADTAYLFRVFTISADVLMFGVQADAGAPSWSQGVPSTTSCEWQARFPVRS